MKTKNALEIIEKQLEKDPALKRAYLEEEKNYHIGCKIREYRKAAGLTQKKLAQLIKTKQSVISRIENAEYQGHSLTLLKKIASVLGIDLEDLFETKNENPQVFHIHIPPIIAKAASFQHWNSAQITIRKSDAR